MAKLINVEELQEQDLLNIAEHGCRYILESIDYYTAKKNELFHSDSMMLRNKTANYSLQEVKNILVK